MNKKTFIGHLFSICLLTLTLAFPSLAVVGQAGTDIAFLKAGVGARALGMGSAFTAVADNADAPYWNPAGLGWITSSEITTMQTKLSTDADHYYISYVQPALGGSFGVSWFQVGMGNTLQTSAEVDIHNEVQNLNSFGSFSNAYMLSYGRKMNDTISFGLSGTYLTSDMYQVSGGQASGFTLTPGALVKLTVNNNPLTMGIKIEDLINQQSWATGTTEKVSPTARLGAAYQINQPGKLTLDVSQRLKTNYSPQVCAGYEWKSGALSFRGGYADTGFTFGAGFDVNHVLIDYAYVGSASLSTSNVHRVSLSGVW